MERAVTNSVEASTEGSPRTPSDVPCRMSEVKPSCSPSPSPSLNPGPSPALALAQALALA